MWVSVFLFELVTVWRIGEVRGGGGELMGEGRGVERGGSTTPQTYPSYMSP